MTNNLPSKHSVAVLISEGLGLFEFGIATEVFGLARPEFDFPWYDFNVVCAASNSVTATGGVTITADYGLDYLDHVDTIIIPSWQHARNPETTAVTAALRAAAARNTRFLSICSGAFLLAEAGLLDGKRATTHWKHIDNFSALYPAIDIEEDSLYVDQGNIICSAGSSAGIDACMHLVRRDYGAVIANQVARRLVSHPHRIGGQKQFIPSPIQVRDKHTISMAMEWALERLSQKISVVDMASQVHMSERTFLRHFRDTTGSTPMEWLQRMRISHAQELLENSNNTVTSISEKSGYQSIETFRVAFKRVTGLSVSAYKSRFRVPTETSKHSLR